MIKTTRCLSYLIFNYSKNEKHLIQIILRKFEMKPLQALKAMEPTSYAVQPIRLDSSNPEQISCTV